MRRTTKVPENEPLEEVVVAGVNRIEYREQWLEKMALRIVRRVEQKLAKMLGDDRRAFPFDKTKFSTGFLKGGLVKGAMPGATHYPSESTGSFYEIIIRNDQDDPVKVAKVLAHQILHVFVGPDHKEAFRDACLLADFDIAQGLRAALPSDDFVLEVIKPGWDELGDYPHKSLNYDAMTRKRAKGESSAADEPKQQESRLLKVKCTKCDLIVRQSQGAIDKYGIAWCAQHGEMLAIPKKQKAEVSAPIVELVSAIEPPVPDQQDNAEPRDAAE